MIKQVKEIPEIPQTAAKSRRAQLREDIREAWDNGIGRFEFDGYGGWKYIAQYAREEAGLFFRKMLRKPFRETYERLYPEEGYYPLPDYKDERSFFKISSRKIDGEVHCYCELFHTGEDFIPYVDELVRANKRQQEEYEKRREENRRKREAQKAVGGRAE